MPFYFYLWDGENDRHIAEHGVTKEEFEEVVDASDEVVESRSSGRPTAVGLTTTGRYLICVFEMIDEVTVYPITAFLSDHRLRTGARLNMVDRQSRRIAVPLSEEGRRRYAESRARIDQIREQVESDLPELIAAARRAQAAREAAQSPTREAIALLKTEREAQGIDLAELETRTGIPLDELSRLEDGRGNTGSLATLNAYAAALGKRLSITLSGAS